MRIIYVFFKLKEKLRGFSTVLEFSQGVGKQWWFFEFEFQVDVVGEAVRGIWGKLQRENIVIYWLKGRGFVWNYEILKMEVKRRKGRVVFQESIQYVFERIQEFKFYGR